MKEVTAMDILMALLVGIIFPIALMIVRYLVDKRKNTRVFEVEREPS